MTCQHRSRLNCYNPAPVAWLFVSSPNPGVIADEISFKRLCDERNRFVPGFKGVQRKGTVCFMYDEGSAFHPVFRPNSRYPHMIDVGQKKLYESTSASYMTFNIRSVISSNCSCPSLNRMTSSFIRLTNSAEERWVFSWTSAVSRSSPNSWSARSIVSVTPSV